MPSNRAPTGFCSIIVERQSYGVLVTVTMNADFTERSGDRVVRLVQLSEALELAGDFLTVWAEQHGGR